jgi:N utilization substance protein B
MSTRRDAREWALQMLFMLDLNPVRLDEMFDAFWADREPDPPAREFAEDLVNGVHDNRQRIDAMLEGYADNWRIVRMAVTDRNVLRMATYEMFYRQDIPPIVSINEAVDLAKYFNCAESGRFVNGILDRARRDLKQPVGE